MAVREPSEAAARLERPERRAPAQPEGEKFAVVSVAVSSTDAAAGRPVCFDPGGVPMAEDLRVDITSDDVRAARAAWVTAMADGASTPRVCQLYDDFLQISATHRHQTEDI